MVSVDFICPVSHQRLFPPLVFRRSTQWTWIFNPSTSICNSLNICYRVWFLLLFPKKRRLSKESTLFCVLICFFSSNCYIEPPYNDLPDNNQSDSPLNCSTPQDDFSFHSSKHWRERKSTWLQTLSDISGWNYRMQSTEVIKGPEQPLWRTPKHTDVFHPPIQFSHLSFLSVIMVIRVCCYLFCRALPASVCETKWSGCNSSTRNSDS